MDTKINTYLTVQDYSVSKEVFQLVAVEGMDYLKTTPQPEADVLGKYYESEDYISHTDAKRSLFEKLYHTIKGYALKRKVALMGSLGTKSKTLLDVGAGTGDFLIAAKAAGWDVTGVEPNSGAIANAAKKGIDLFADMRLLPQQQYDVITLWHVLEHLPDLENQIARLVSLVRPNGALVIAVPNYKSYDAAHYKEFWAAYDVPRHLWHFSQAAIQKLFLVHGFTLVKTKPLIFDAFYVSLLSEKYKSGKMNFFTAFRVGLRSNVQARRSGEYSSLIYILKKG